MIPKYAEYIVLAPSNDINSTNLLPKVFPDKAGLKLSDILEFIPTIVAMQTKELVIPEKIASPMFIFILPVSWYEEID